MNSVHHKRLRTQHSGSFVVKSTLRHDADDRYVSCFSRTVLERFDFTIACDVFVIISEAAEKPRCFVHPRTTPATTMFTVLCEFSTLAVLKFFLHLYTTVNTGVVLMTTGTL